jgi:hypothetical protein
MSKQLTALLLKRKVDSIKNPVRRHEYLINCLKSHGLIKEELPPEPVTSISHDTCKLCNSNEFIYISNSMVCKHCGVSESSFQLNPFKTYKQDLNFSKSTFIAPGEQIVTVIKDGKPVKRDLSKIQTWLDSTPEELRIKTDMLRINETLDKIASNYNPVIFDRVKNIILSMWYNILTIKTVWGRNEKKSLEIWTIYYPMVYHEVYANGTKNIINIQQLVSMYGVYIGEVYSFNFVMKDIFKNSAFKDYVSIPTGSIVDLELTSEMAVKLKKVKKDLEMQSSNPLKDKELYGMVYYIGKILGFDKKYTLTFLFNKTTVSPNLISDEAKRIELFYKEKPGKLRQLLI